MTKAVIMLLKMSCFWTPFPPEAATARVEEMARTIPRANTSVSWEHQKDSRQARLCNSVLQVLPWAMVRGSEASQMGHIVT